MLWYSMISLLPPVWVHPENNHGCVPVSTRPSRRRTLQSSFGPQPGGFSGLYLIQFCVAMLYYSRLESAVKECYFLTFACCTKFPSPSTANTTAGLSLYAGLAETYRSKRVGESSFPTKVNALNSGNLTAPFRWVLFSQVQSSALSIKISRWKRISDFRKVDDQASGIRVPVIAIDELGRNESLAEFLQQQLFQVLLLLLRSIEHRSGMPKLHPTHVLSGITEDHR